MRHALKWSTQLANGEWAALEIEFDESDLHRTFFEAGIDPAKLNQISSVEAYQLAELEVQRLLVLTQIQRFTVVLDTPENREKLGKLSQQRANLIAKLQARLNGEQ